MNYKKIVVMNDTRSTRLRGFEVLDQSTKDGRFRKVLAGSVEGFKLQKFVIEVASGVIESEAEISQNNAGKYWEL